MHGRFAWVRGASLGARRSKRVVLTSLCSTCLGDGCGRRCESPPASCLKTQLNDDVRTSQAVPHQTTAAPIACQVGHREAPSRRPRKRNGDRRNFGLRLARECANDWTGARCRSERSGRGTPFANKTNEDAHDVTTPWDREELAWSEPGPSLVSNGALCDSSLSPACSMPRHTADAQVMSRTGIPSCNWCCHHACCQRACSAGHAARPGWLLGLAARL